MTYGHTDCKRTDLLCGRYGSGADAISRNEGLINNKQQTNYEN